MPARKTVSDDVLEYMVHARLMEMLRAPRPRRRQHYIPISMNSLSKSLHVSWRRVFRALNTLAAKKKIANVGNDGLLIFRFFDHFGQHPKRVCVMATPVAPLKKPEPKTVRLLEGGKSNDAA